MRLQLPATPYCANGTWPTEWTEDGVIWVYRIGDDQVMAFTDFGIENLTELIRMHKEDPELLKRWDR